MMQNDATNQSVYTQKPCNQAGQFLKLALLELCVTSFRTHFNPFAAVALPLQPDRTHLTRFEGRAFEVTHAL